MRLSDIIAAHINQMLDSGEDGAARLKRNELAEELGCVPSQINYVIASRFTPEQGYIVESRRGGGGYILIRRIRHQRDMQALMHTVNSIGSSLSYMLASSVLDNLAFMGTLQPLAVRIMSAALSDQVYRDIPAAARDRLRAAQLKCMLAAILT